MTYVPVHGVSNHHTHLALTLRKESDGSFTLETEADHTWPVVLMENVVTTGGSRLRAAECLAEAGYEIGGLVTFVDWGMGGRESSPRKPTKAKWCLSPKEKMQHGLRLKG